MNDSFRFTEAFLSVRRELDRWVQRAREFWARSDPWALAGWTIGGLLLVSLLLPVLVTLAIAVGIVALVLGWLHEFLFLMGLGDESFPARYDKLIWVVLFLILPPVGAVAFWMYRHACWPGSKSSPWQDDPDSLA
ncbi:MAG TPA: hypothetical protein VFT74_01985 [Isosphaeraceae bacterium]|nr:hypothetical protein [Isosphaeraceae bacterium]